MFKKLSLFIGLLFTVFIFSVSIVEACSCSRKTACQAFSNADVVFVGRIIKATEKKGVVDHQVQVDESFFGAESGSLVNVLTDNMSSCRYRMTENESYLIYAWKDDKNVLRTGMCSRTTGIVAAKGDLKYLRSVKESGNIGGTIQGKVVDEKSADKEKTKKPERVDKVWIERKDSREVFTTEIESDGSYKLTGLEKGKYRAYLNLPEGFITDGETGAFSDEEDTESQFEEVNNRGCTVYDFVVKLNGIISGKVVDADRIPLKRFKVNLISSSSEKVNKNDKNK